MAVRHGGVELLIDPWLVGSCYWRSWWNYPEPPAEVLAQLKPDFIYLTHLHWDHFHGPSLRRFAPHTKMLVPKLPTTRRMVEDLEWLGFRDVTELAHGESLELGGGLQVTSFQSGIGADSMLAITDGRTTILDANDCKMFGSSLDQVARRFPKIDFVLRSHSSASPVPYCVDSYPQRFADVRSKQDYAEEFARFAFTLRARYAIPFASNHCYLHRDTIRYNDLATDPQLVHDLTNREAARLGVETRSVLMAAGSKWSDSGGFEIVPFDYSRRDEYLQGLLAKHHDKLESCYREEATIEPDAEACVSYFEALFADLPPRTLVRMALDFQILIEVHGASTRRFLLDFGKRQLVLDAEPSERMVTIRVPARVFNDCCKQRMFSTWSASKRLSVHVPPSLDLSALGRFLTLLDLHELGQLPIRNNLQARALWQRLLRWREVIDFGSYVWQSRTRQGFRISDLYPMRRTS
jgi:UDP-MurNAc hydroxylase